MCAVRVDVTADLCFGPSGWQLGSENLGVGRHHTSSTSCATPLRSKNQWDLIVRELLNFAGLVGHSELVYICDNEPTLRQPQRMVVNARLLGLPTCNIFDESFQCKSEHHPSTKTSLVLPAPTLEVDIERQMASPVGLNPPDTACVVLVAVSILLRAA